MDYISVLSAITGLLIHCYDTRLIVNITVLHDNVWNSFFKPLLVCTIYDIYLEERGNRGVIYHLLTHMINSLFGISLLLRLK